MRVMNKQTNIPSRVPLVALAVSCATSALSVEAAEADASASQELAPYVVVATRTPLTLDRVSPSVSYISAEEMEFWQDRRVVDALEREAGVAVNTNGASGAVASLYARGTQSNHTAFFLDGRRLSPATSGQYDLESLAVNNLESVQLQKGASSVNYGSSGIGGVVDLRTAATYGYTDEGALLEGEFGSNHASRVGTTAFLARDNWGVSFGASALTTDNERENDEYATDSGTARFDYRIVENLSFELLGTYTEATKGVPGSINGTVSDYNESVAENWLISPGLKYASDEITAHLFYSASEYSYDYDYRYANSYSAIESDEVSLQVDYSFTDHLLLTAGGLYRRDDVLNRGNYDDYIEQYGGFGQFIYQVSERIEVRCGLRYDDYNQHDESMTGSLETVYKLLEWNAALFAKAATAYAPPTGQDLAFDNNQDASYNSVDTPLAPEESVSFEIGFRQNLMDGDLAWTLVAFRNEIEDLIQYVSYPSYASDTYNVEEATIEGVEFGADFQLNAHMAFSFGYTYLSTKADEYVAALNEFVDRRLAYRPRHTLQGSIVVTPSEYFRVGLNLTGQFDREYTDLYGTGEAHEADDFMSADLVADWALTEQLEVFARVDNLFDKEYESTDGYPSLGRAAYIGARLNF